VEAEFFRRTFHPMPAFHFEHVLNEIHVRKNLGFDRVHFRSSASELHFNEMAIVHDLEKTQVVWILAVYRELHGIKGMDQSSVSN